MIRITIPAMVILLTAIFLFMAATNIQGGWLYMVDGFLWSILFVSVFIPLMQLRGLQIERHHPATCHESQPMEIQLSVTNPGRLPVVFLGIRDMEPQKICGIKPRIPKNREKGFILLLKHRQKFNFTYTINALPRGLYVLPKVEIISFGAFGLFGVVRKMEVSTVFTVQPTLPSRLSRLSRGDGIGTDSGKISRKKSDSSLLISHFRDYQPGDNKRLIHWKNTARQNKLIIYEMKEEIFRSALLIFDTDRGQNDQNFEARILAAARLIAYFLYQQYELEIMAQPTASIDWQRVMGENPKRHLHHVSIWKQASNWLATLEPDANQELSQWLEQVLPSKPVECIIFTDRINQALIRVLNQYRQIGGTATIYHTDPEPIATDIRTVRVGSKPTPTS